MPDHTAADNAALLPSVFTLIRAECDGELPRGFVSTLQRRLRLGYTRACEIVELLEERGMVGAANKDGTREIFSLPESDAGTDSTTNPQPSPTAMPKQPQQDSDELLHVPFADIHIEDGFNVRKDFGESLEDSIAAHGIQQALIGWRDADGQLRLVEGARRLDDLGKVLDSGRLKHGDPKAQVPFIVRPAYADRAVRTAAMLIFGGKNGAKPLTMSERARAIQRLSQDHGRDNAEIAKLEGITATAVADHLDLLVIVHEGILAAVDADRCAATFALDLARTVPDKDDQWAHFGEAMKKAGPDSRISAKHLGIAIGKAAAAKKRNSLTTAAEPQQCRVCGCTEQDCSQCIAVTGTACTWVSPDLCSRCHAEQNTGLSAAGETPMDHEGRFHKPAWEIVLDMPEESKAKVTLLIHRDPDMSRMRFLYGYEVKWPGVFRPGAKHQAGYKKDLPNISGPAADMYAKAELHAAQAARCELEVQDFAKGDKPAALAALTAHIDRLAESFGDDVHEPEPEQSSVISDQSSATTPTGVQITAPHGDFSEFFTLCYQLRDHYTGGKPAPKFDAMLAAVRERLGNEAAMSDRAERRIVVLNETIIRLADEADQFRGRIAELEAAASQPATSDSGEAAPHPAIAALTHVLDNAPDAENREPHRLETLQVVHDAFTGSLSTTASAKILQEWVCGVHQTPEEAREAGHQ